MKKHHLYTVNTKDLNANIAGIIEQASILGPITSDKLASLISNLVKKEVDHAVSYALILGMTPDDNPPCGDSDCQCDDVNRAYAEG